MNTCLRRTVLASACAFAALATSAGANPPQPQPDYVNSMRISNDSRPDASDLRARFEQFDANHDRLIDRTEAGASRALAARFDALDGDHDGSLTLREFRAIRDIAAIRPDAAPADR